MRPGVWEVRRVGFAILRGVIDGLAIAAIMALCGCSLNTRPIGTKDPGVEIARSNAEAEKARATAQVEMMKALVAALNRLGASLPATPPALCLSTDGITIVPCQEVVR